MKIKPSCFCQFCFSSHSLVVNSKSERSLSQIDFAANSTCSISRKATNRAQTSAMVHNTLQKLCWKLITKTWYCPTITPFKSIIVMMKELVNWFTKFCRFVSSNLWKILKILFEFGFFDGSKWDIHYQTYIFIFRSVQ